MLVLPQFKHRADTMKLYFSDNKNPSIDSKLTAKDVNSNHEGTRAEFIAHVLSQIEALQAGKSADELRAIFNDLMNQSSFAKNLLAKKPLQPDLDFTAANIAEQLAAHLVLEEIDFLLPKERTDCPIGIYPVVNGILFNNDPNWYEISEIHQWIVGGESDISPVTKRRIFKIISTYQFEANTVDLTLNLAVKDQIAEIRNKLIELDIKNAPLRLDGQLLQELISLARALPTKPGVLFLTMFATNFYAIPIVLRNVLSSHKNEIYYGGATNLLVWLNYILTMSLWNAIEEFQRERAERQDSSTAIIYRLFSRVTSIMVSALTPSETLTDAMMGFNHILHGVDETDFAADPDDDVVVTQVAPVIANINQVQTGSVFDRRNFIFYDDNDVQVPDGNANELENKDDNNTNSLSI